MTALTASQARTPRQLRMAFVRLCVCLARLQFSTSVVTIFLCTFFTCRVRRFYACCPGNTLVFVTGGRPNTSRPVDATNRLILCQLPRPTTPPRKFAVSLSPSWGGAYVSSYIYTNVHSSSDY